MTQLKPSEKELYRLINKSFFIKPVELSSFWFSDRICVPVQNFIDMMQFIGIQVSGTNAKKLQEQVELISLQNVIQNVSYWKSRQQDIGTYLSKKSPKKIQKDYQQERSSMPSSHQSKLGINQNLNSILNRKFLALHAKKQFHNKIKLNRTLRNVKNQSNYQLTLKIGEANDICSKLKNGTMYALQTHENGKIQILVNQKGQPEAKISQKKFITQYEDHKSKIMSQAQEIEGTLEEDLKKVLVEVMCLSSDMKKQIKLLESKGISH